MHPAVLLLTIPLEVVAYSVRLLSSSFVRKRTFFKQSALSSRFLSVPFGFPRPLYPFCGLCYKVWIAFSREIHVSLSSQRKQSFFFFSKKKDWFSPDVFVTGRFQTNYFRLLGIIPHLAIHFHFRLLLHWFVDVCEISTCCSCSMSCNSYTEVLAIIVVITMIITVKMIIVLCPMNINARGTV